MGLKFPSSSSPTLMFRGCQSGPSNGYNLWCSVFVELVETSLQHQMALQSTMIALNWLTMLYTSIYHREFNDPDPSPPTFPQPSAETLHVHKGSKEGEIMVKEMSEQNYITAG